jgi:hypothetical protein
LLRTLHVLLLSLLSLSAEMTVPPPAQAHLDAADRLLFVRPAPKRAVVRQKGVKLAQKLGQLQSSIAVFPLECMGQLAYFGPT